MVTKKEISGFTQTLTTALQKSGYTAFGRISSSEDTFNTYAHLPVPEMVSQYVEDNTLDEINRVYRVVKHINDNSGKYYSLKTLCIDNGIDYKVFSHAVENMAYLDKTGDRRKTQYHWINEDQPSFNTAKEIVEHMRKLKSTSLTKRLKDKIRQAVTEGISKDDFFKSNKIKKEATYSAEAYFNYQKIRQQKRNQDDDITESLPDNTFQPESSTIILERDFQDNTDQENAVEKSVLKEEDAPSTPEVIDEAGLQYENYILRQEIKYLKKINKAKNKLLKAMRKKA
jgi:hypothetical protein